MANINLICYSPHLEFSSEHAQWVEKAVYAALEDVAAHHGSASQLMGTFPRRYPTEDLSVDEPLDILVVPNAAMTWEM